MNRNIDGAVKPLYIYQLVNPKAIKHFGKINVFTVFFFFFFFFFQKKKCVSTYVFNIFFILIHISGKRMRFHFRKSYNR